MSFEEALETAPVMSMFANKADCLEARERHFYTAGVQAERERLQPYIDQLEQAWLQLTRGNLIDGGMKVEQARIHAQVRLDEAKHKILSSAIRGQG